MFVMQEDAIDIEGNMIASGKMKKKKIRQRRKMPEKIVVLLIQVETPKKKIWIKCPD
jgi:hypothetical protein